MATSTTLHDVKALVLSSHPVLAVVTVEEERVRELLKAVATERGQSTALQSSGSPNKKRSVEERSTVMVER